MVGQVPSTRPPGYGAQFGSMLTNASAARGEAVAAELDARASALGDILGNIKGIAEVGGGNIAPDKLISQFAGGDVPIFTGEYAGMMDRLRLAQAQADVAATGRKGTGGGSGSGLTIDPGSSLVQDYDAQGNPVGTPYVMDNADLTTIARLREQQTGVSPRVIPPYEVQGPVVSTTKGKGSAAHPIATGEHVDTRAAPKQPAAQPQPVDQSNVATGSNTQTEIVKENGKLKYRLPGSTEWITVGE